MISLQHISGDVLTLVFSPEGALSSAKYRKQNVASALKYTRADDYAECLATFGFKRTWDKKIHEAALTVNKKIATYKLEILNAVPCDSSTVDLLLCATTDNHPVHKRTKIVLRYDLVEHRFVRVVRLFDLDKSVYESLMRC